MTNNTTADTTDSGAGAADWKCCMDIRLARTDGKGGVVLSLNGCEAPEGIDLFHGGYVDALRAKLEAAEREVGQLHMLVKQREEYAIQKSAETLVAIRRAEAAEDDAERWAFVAADHSTAWADEIDEAIEAAKAATP